MIEKLKKKTICILTIVFWMVLIGILVSVNVSNYYFNRSMFRHLLQGQKGIVEIEGDREIERPVGEVQENGSIYSVSVQKDGTYQLDFYIPDGIYSEGQLIEITKKIVALEKTEGIMDNFAYLVDEQETETLVSFIDISMWQQQQVRMLMYSTLILVVGLVVLFGVALGLSRWMIRPVVLAFDKQKQFISDAGHELKTPLTIMKASLELLELKYGQEEHFQYLKEENARMTNLVHELLTLSRLESEQGEKKLDQVSLSKAVEGASLPFESLIYEEGFVFSLQVEEDIYITGNEQQIYQLVEILLDNAIKHTFPNGSIVVEVTREKEKPVLMVKNQGEAIDEQIKAQIFDRFFRADKARSRSEGRYGLGLAIASSIAEKHNAKISVECSNQWTVFSVSFQ